MLKDWLINEIFERSSSTGPCRRWDIYSQCLILSATCAASDLVAGSY